jgi:hypothetical protein
MNANFRHQLNHLDRALLALLDERARLVSSATVRSTTTAAVDDLLRRRDGPIEAQAVRRFFEAVDEACEPFRGKLGGAP